MATAQDINIVLRATDKVSDPLRKMGTSVKRFGKLTDDQMRKVEKFSTKMSGIGKSATGESFIIESLSLGTPYCGNLKS